VFVIWTQLTGDISYETPRPYVALRRTQHVAARRRSVVQRVTSSRTVWYGLVRAMNEEENNCTSENRCKSPLWYRGRKKVDQSSANLGSKCPLARPPIMPNVIAIGQTVYEKSITIFLHPSLFWGPRGPHEPKFTSLGGDVQQGRLHQVVKFRRFG